jgi:predicted DNA-binding transcriptional regulator YafY
MKLFNTYKKLIVEAASIDEIVRTIKQRKRVIIYYDGDEPGGKGLRIVEPVCYGYSKSGNPVLRAWDVEGASHRAYLGEKPLPSWRMFRIDKIINYKPTLEDFNEMRPGYNPNGDKSMTRVIINAVFDQQTPTSQDAIIDRMIDTLLDEYRTNYGDNFDLSKAADAYRRIYQEIEKETNKKLSSVEKSTLRSIISNKILQKQ